MVSHIGPGFPQGEWRGGWWAPSVESDERFGGFEWRSAADLLVNYIWVYAYTEREPGHQITVWFDDIVVASSYIGPLQAPTDFPHRQERSETSP